MDRTNKSWVRISLQTLFFVVLCLGGVLGGYRAGFERGLRAGADARMYPVTYQVAELVIPLDVQSNLSGGFVEADFESLEELITTTIDPETWDAGGGQGSIKRFETNLSLVISQTRRTHEKIAELLKGLRNNARKNGLAKQTQRPSN